MPWRHAQVSQSPAKAGSTLPEILPCARAAYAAHDSHRMCPSLQVPWDAMYLDEPDNAPWPGRQRQSSARSSTAAGWPAAGLRSPLPAWGCAWPAPAHTQHAAGTRLAIHDLVRCHACKLGSTFVPAFCCDAPRSACCWTSPDVILTACWATPNVILTGCLQVSGIGSCNVHWLRSWHANSATLRGLLACRGAHHCSRYPAHANGAETAAVHP